MLNFIAKEIQLYKIFKITQVSFFWHTLYKFRCWQAAVELKIHTTYK